jgi:hypothetical protein
MSPHPKGTQMTPIIRPALASVAAVAAVIAGAQPATAAPHGDYFVVNTNDVTSPIIEAGGAFADCTTVTDLWGSAEQIGPNRLLFIGDKLVECDSGDVTIHFNATINFNAGKKTRGHWFVVESTLPGVTDGFGTVRGDNSHCDPGPDGFCILDVFAGDVS